MAKDADTGKWASVCGSWARSKKSAEIEERKLLTRRDRDQLAPTRGRTVGQYLQLDYLPGLAKVSKRGIPLAPTTKSKYARNAARIAEHIGDVPLKSLRASHVETLRDTLGEDLAPQSVADVLGFLSRALHKAETKGLITRNYADASVVDRPSGKVRDFEIITPELGKRILKAARGADPWDAAVALALGLSLRREEVLALEWSAVDLDAGTVRVEQTLTYADRGVHWGPPKSAAGVREIPAPKFVVEALKRHKIAQGKRRWQVGEAWWSERDLVVDLGDGSPWLPPTFSTYWTRWAKRQGFPKVTFHTLRHGTATLLLAAGVPDAVAVAIMGHADTRILARYQDVIEDLKRDATDKLGELLGEGRK
jgi:integrase